MNWLRRDLGAWMLAGVIALAGWGGCGSRGPEKSGQSQARVGQAVAEFRIRAIMDPVEAMRQVATPEAVQALGRIEKKLFTLTVPKDGWSFFFSSSVYHFGLIGGDRHRVIFYHPWSDVALLTTWDASGAQPQLVAAELVLGDALRQKGVPPFDLEPKWEKESKDLTPILSLPLSVGATLRAFELLYPSSSGGDEKGRGSFEKALADPSVVQGMEVAANIRFEKSVGALARYLTDPVFQPHRENLQLILQDLRVGDVSRVQLTIPETNREIFDFVKKQGVRIGTQYRVAGALKSGIDYFLFLQHPEDPNTVLVFWMQQDGALYGLRQVGLVQYNVAVAGYDDLRAWVESTRQANKTEASR